MSLVTAASGPITNSQSLAPVMLGATSDFGSFDGTAESKASYRTLGASAHANIPSGTPSNPVALFSSTGAAWFSDTLAASSPLVANASAGFVRYQFSVDGSLSSLGTPAAYYFGDAYMVLDLQHQGGGLYDIASAHIRRGEAGTILNGPPVAGWTTSTGSLSGASTFYSLDLPMNWGQAWDVQVGLLAWAYGTADAQFPATAKLTGIELFGASHTPVTQFSISSASGTNYVDAVPEPQTLAFMLSGLGMVGFAAQRKGLASPGVPRL